MNKTLSILTNWPKALLLSAMCLVFITGSAITVTSGFQQLQSLNTPLVKNINLSTVPYMDGVKISENEVLQYFDTETDRCHRWLGYRFAALPESVMNICQQLHLQSNPSS